MACTTPTSTDGGSASPTRHSRLPKTDPRDGKRQQATSSGGREQREEGKPRHHQMHISRAGAAGTQYLRWHRARHTQAPHR